MTDAAQYEGALLPGLLDKANTASDVWADTAYRSSITVASHRDLDTLLRGFNQAYNARCQRVLKGWSPEGSCASVSAQPQPAPTQSRSAVRSLHLAQGPSARIPQMDGNWGDPWALFSKRIQSLT